MLVQPRRRAALLTLVTLFGTLLLLSAPGCTKTEVGIPPADYISPRLRPSDVVNNLVVAYKRRKIEEYSKLLADDFQFWFDPASRPATVPDFWTRLQDSTGTGNLFAAQEILDVRISLTYDKADKPDNQINHVGWRKILVTDTFLEVDKAPDTGQGEVTTFRVDGDEQQYYFRKGRTPADTLASSPTSREWFLVEWHDLAHPAGPTDVASK